MSWSLAYVALGLFTGFSAGMLGIGGGLVMVPVLTMLFSAQGHFPVGETLHIAGRQIRKVSGSRAAPIFGALRQGMRTMGHEAMALVAADVTTIDEVIRNVYLA